MSGIYVKSDYYITDDPYETLANAIILQAVRDYRTALKTLKKPIENDKHRARYHRALSVKRDCERFFRSQWFFILCNFDGEELLKRLKVEAEKGEEVDALEDI